MKNKGFTFIEIMVTLFILAIVLSAVYMTFNNSLFQYKEESKKTSTQMEKSVASNIIRLDLEHLGFGIGINETQPIISWDGTDLILRSTINTTNDNTIGWALVEWDNTTSTKLAGDNLTSLQQVVWLDADNKSIKSNGTFGTNPGAGIYLAYPYKQVSGTPASGCTNQFCNKITYSLSTTAQSIDTCNPNTKNLLRKVGNGTGEPVLDCVADWNILFLWDGAISNIIPNDSEIRDKLKRVDFYAVVQEGQRDRDYTYPSPTIDIDGITLNLPADYEHYRWKVIKISVKPMGL
jgi:type IV pilus assembly protein PilW